jgi:hypothetical protein
MLKHRERNIPGRARLLTPPLVSGRNSTQQPIALPMIKSVANTKAGRNHDALLNWVIRRSMPPQPSPDKRDFRQLGIAESQLTISRLIETWDAKRIRDASCGDLAWNRPQSRRDQFQSRRYRRHRSPFRATSLRFVRLGLGTVLHIHAIAA